MRERKDFDTSPIIREENLMTRRDFGKLALTGAKAAAAGYAAKLVYKYIDYNESDTKFWFETELLEDLACDWAAAGHRQRFGFYPDFDQKGKVNPWEQIDQYQEIEPITENFLLAMFLNLEDLASPERRDVLGDRLLRIQATGATPVISTGTNSISWRGHPFHPDNEQLMIERLYRMGEFIGSLNLRAPVHRLFYEMSITQSHVPWGPGKGLPRELHAQQFHKIFSYADEIFSQTVPTMQLVSVPSVNDDVLQYVVRMQEENGEVKIVGGGVGVDGYGLFPGKGKWDNLYYWYPGNASPESIFYRPLSNLLKAVNGEVEVGVWEMNRIFKEPRWLKHAAWLTYAMGCGSLMYFDYDKSYLSSKYPWETDWTTNSEIRKMFRELREKLERARQQGIRRRKLEAQAKSAGIYDHPWPVGES